MLKIYNILCLPAIIIHELLHIIVTYLVGGRVCDIVIHKYEDFDKTFGLACEVFAVSPYRFQNTMISLAPILAFLIAPIVFHFSITAGFCVLGYQLLTLLVVIPSKEDIDSIKNFKTREELDAEFDEFLEQKKTTK